MTSSDEIKRLRRRMKVTQKEFALLMGVSKDCVARWEQGSRNIGRTNLKKIQRWLKKFPDV